MDKFKPTDEIKKLLQEKRKVDFPVNDSSMIFSLSLPDEGLLGSFSLTIEGEETKIFVALQTT